MASESGKSPDLTGFKALSFDCYGTLIDWERGFSAPLHAITSQLPPTHPYRKQEENEDRPVLALQRFAELVAERERAQPGLLYNELLVECASALASELGVTTLSDGAAEPFGNAPGTWDAFPDSVAGLQRLARAGQGRYKLCILSNVDNRNIAATLGRALDGCRFDAVCTAQDAGSYKPDLRNFEYLLRKLREEFGVEKDEVLHVAHSVSIDHVPAKQLGLRSVWISRGAQDGGRDDIHGNEAEEYKGQAAYEWRFDTIEQLADEVERQFAAKNVK
ncbi:haloacid dehalogenase- type II [Apiospora rasikravindrae]|uniref:Haloacid dehalogenase- type II n=1 Tax=Apiospora rasikravindrae TaxID=990691 RepID=A0ABR1RQH6_9PEZI